MNGFDLNLLKPAVKIILHHTPNAKIFLFGSRANGNFTENSDADIAIKSDSKIDLETLAKIKMDLEELDINFKIDIIDYNSLSENFRKIIDKSSIEL
ncbi:MAG: nucleotidyltransferase domain-containing protein [Elusimicrobia bacterium]|nr:nucleotidyltransferase domain-containing protein [Elusimicrobiota bacterium]